MDHENSTASIAAHNAAAEGRVSQDESLVCIPRSTLRRSLAQAEQSVDEILAQIRDMESQRNEHARGVGAAQDALDRLEAEKERRTAHVRSLLSAG